MWRDTFKAEGERKLGILEGRDLMIRGEICAMKRLITHPRHQTKNLHKMRFST